MERDRKRGGEEKRVNMGGEGQSYRQWKIIAGRSYRGLATAKALRQVDTVKTAVQQKRTGQICRLVSSITLIQVYLILPALYSVKQNVQLPVDEAPTFRR